MQKADSIVYKELELLPAYTPNYVVDQLKEYLKVRPKEKGEYRDFWFQDLLGIVNYAKTRKKITRIQAFKLKKILKKMK